MKIVHDSPPVLTRPGDIAVRVEVRDNPEIEVGLDAEERTGDRDPGALVAVDAPDHQHRCPGRLGHQQTTHAREVLRPLTRRIDVEHHNTVRERECGTEQARRGR